MVPTRRVLILAVFALLAAPAAARGAVFADDFEAGSPVGWSGQVGSVSVEPAVGAGFGMFSLATARDRAAKWLARDVAGERVAASVCVVRHSSGEQPFLRFVRNAVAVIDDGSGRLLVGTPAGRTRIGTFFIKVGVAMCLRVEVDAAADVVRVFRGSTLLGEVPAALEPESAVQVGDLAPNESGPWRFDNVVIESSTATPPPPPPVATWTGDFETGDLSQWAAKDAPVDGIQVVADPVRQGSHAARFSLAPGEGRAELSTYGDQMFSQDQEAWFAWSTMFMPGFPAPADWALFAQWKPEYPRDGSPPAAMAVRSESVYFQSGPDDGWYTAPPLPIARGTWHDWLVHIRFSRSGDGFIEIWHNGEVYLPRRRQLTVYSAPSFFKLGYYRSSAIDARGTVVHDGMRSGPTRESVGA